MHPKSVSISKKNNSQNEVKHARHKTKTYWYSQLHKNRVALKHKSDTIIHDPLHLTSCLDPFRIKRLTSTYRRKVYGVLCYDSASSPISRSLARHPLPQFRRLHSAKISHICMQIVQKHIFMFLGSFTCHHIFQHVPNNSINVSKKMRLKQLLFEL